MFGITDIYLFIIAGILLNITPGVDMLYILNNTFSKGFKAGVIATFGINVGCLFHVFLAVVGLSALLQASAVAFMVVKYIGVVYLVYLGCAMLFKPKSSSPTLEQSKEKSLKKIFLDGVFINILNPKVAIFFITFLPQFIDVDSANQSMGLLILGLVFIFFGTIVSIIVAYGALNISSKFTYSDMFTTVIKKVVGVLFVLFGIKLGADL